MTKKDTPLTAEQVEELLKGINILTDRVIKLESNNTKPEPEPETESKTDKPTYEQLEKDNVKLLEEQDELTKPGDKVEKNNYIDTINKIYNEGSK